MNVGQLPRWLQPAPDSLTVEIRKSGGRVALHLLNVLWSFWVFFTVFFTDVGPAYWISLAVSYPLFLAVFGLLYIRPRRDVPVLVAAMAMLAFASAPFNPSAWSYAVFACVFVSAENCTPRNAVLKILLIQSLMLVEAWLLGWPWPILVLLVSVCSSAGFGALAGHVSQRRQAQLNLSQDEVRRLAASAERERIGRDLHDLLGHTLSLITLKLELSRKLFDRDHQAARKELGEAEDIARHALAEVRAAVTGIRTTDLAAELASAHLLLESGGVQMDYEPPALELPATIEPVLALIVREAATNIARHARATHARFELDTEREHVLLHISDNGQGGIRTSGNGLSGMRERVQMLDGEMEVDSPRGGGTRLRIRVPIPQTRGETEIPDRQIAGPARKTPGADGLVGAQG